MPRRQTMETWISRFQLAADLESDDHMEDPTWKLFASLVYGELWSEVSNTAGRYFETSTTIPADGSTSYDEPTNHYSTARIVRVDASGRETPLREITQQEQAAYVGLTGEAAGYCLVDDQLFLHPTPSSGTYKWYYLQQPTDLSSADDADLIDTVCPAGDAFFLWGVVLLAQQRGERNVQLAMAEKERARELVQLWAAQRNFYESKQRPADPDDDWPYSADGWPIR